MKADAVVKALGPWLSDVRRPGWKPVVEEGDVDSAASKFCGMPWTDSESDWPGCKACGGPLTLLVQLDLDALPAELGDRFGTGLLQLFYCVREGCDGEGGWEPFSDHVSRVRVVHPKTGSAEPIADDMPSLPARTIVGWERFDDLPSPAEHDENGLGYTYNFNDGTLRIECPQVGLDLEQRINECSAEEIALAVCGDKLGGWPAWVQGVEYPVCPICEARMGLVFQLDSEDNVPYMFGDVGTGHITQCPNHKDVVAFGWACS